MSKNIEYSRSILKIIEFKLDLPLLEWETEHQLNIAKNIEFKLIFVYTQLNTQFWILSIGKQAFIEDSAS